MQAQNAHSSHLTQSNIQTGSRVCLGRSLSGDSFLTQRREGFSSGETSDHHAAKGRGPSLQADTQAAGGVELPAVATHPLEHDVAVPLQLGAGEPADALAVP